MSAFIKFSSFFICVFLVALSCTQKKIPVQYNSEFQKKMNEQFKDASRSPLKPKDLKEFTSLSFFPIDSVFVVKAKLTPTPDSDYFDMKTTTALVTKERIYGGIVFQIIKPVCRTKCVSRNRLDSIKTGLSFPSLFGRYQW